MKLTLCPSHSRRKSRNRSAAASPSACLSREIIGRSRPVECCPGIPQLLERLGLDLARQVRNPAGGAGPAGAPAEHAFCRLQVNYVPVPVFLRDISEGFGDAVETTRAARLAVQVGEGEALAGQSPLEASKDWAVAAAHTEGPLQSTELCRLRAA